jgi:hypothetical protein
MLHGMSGEKIENLVPLAKSWISAPEIKAKGLKSKGYDPRQMAYVLNNTDAENNVSIQLNAKKEQPMITPAFVIKNWGSSMAEVKMNGESLIAGKDFQQGLVDTADGTNLVLWIDKASEKKVSFELTKK